MEHNMTFLFKLSELNQLIEDISCTGILHREEVSVTAETEESVDRAKKVSSRIIDILIWMKENELYEVD
jgi:hypothetical protein